MNQDIKVKNLLLYSFLGIYCLTAVGTLSMLFLGVGDVRENERTLLINAVLIETAAAVFALFYSSWNINKVKENVLEHTKELIVNPLEDSFKDLVIPLEALKLPRVQLHERKRFTRCKFIGPGALTFIGGTFVSSTFIECGDVIAIPNKTLMTGVIGLSDCIVEDCEFLHTTILLSENDAANFVKSVPGTKLAGS